MNITGEVKILKDDRGVYKTTLVRTDKNQETGEDEKSFMKINVGFKKGVEVKNKTKINIKSAFLTFYKLESEETDENGKHKMLCFPKIIVMEFDVIEEGIDEVQTYKKKEDTANNSITSDTWTEYDDDLPF